VLIMIRHFSPSATVKNCRTILFILGIESSEVCHCDDHKRKMLLAESANMILESSRLGRLEKTKLFKGEVRTNSVHLPYDLYQRVMQMYTIGVSLTPIPTNYELSLESMSLYLFGRNLAKLFLSTENSQYNFRPSQIGIKGPLSIENHSLIRWIENTKYYDLSWRIVHYMVFEKCNSQELDSPQKDALKECVSNTLVKDATHDEIRDSVQYMLKLLRNASNLP